MTLYKKLRAILHPFLLENEIKSLMADVKETFDNEMLIDDQALQNQTEIIAKVRKSLLSVESGSGAFIFNDGISLAEAAYQALLILAEFQPLNTHDIISLEEIVAMDEVFVSSGHKLNIVNLVDYHNLLTLQKSVGQRLWPKNNYTNKEFSARECRHLMRIAANHTPPLVFDDLVIPAEIDAQSIIGFINYSREFFQQPTETLFSEIEAAFILAEYLKRQAIELTPITVHMIKLLTLIWITDSNLSRIYPTLTTSAWVRIYDMFNPLMLLTLVPNVLMRLHLHSKHQPGKHYVNDTVKDVGIFLAGLLIHYTSRFIVSEEQSLALFFAIAYMTLENERPLSQNVFYHDPMAAILKNMLMMGIFYLINSTLDKEFTFRMLGAYLGSQGYTACNDFKDQFIERLKPLQNPESIVGAAASKVIRCSSSFFKPTLRANTPANHEHLDEFDMMMANAPAVD